MLEEQERRGSPRVSGSRMLEILRTNVYESFQLLCVSSDPGGGMGLC